MVVIAGGAVSGVRLSQRSARVTGCGWRRRRAGGV